MRTVCLVCGPGRTGSTTDAREASPTGYVQRMNVNVCHRGLVLAVLFAVATGCVCDPTCRPACFGDVLTNCTMECQGSRDDFAVPKCTRVVTDYDCSSERGLSGKPKVCRLREVQGSPVVPGCFDVGLPRCDPREGSVQCTGPNSTGDCYALTTTEGYLTPIDAVVCEPGVTQCHPALLNFRCVLSPLQSCEPGVGFPSCTGNSLRDCVGGYDAGWAVAENDCGMYSCQADAGPARCQ